MKKLLLIAIALVSASCVSQGGINSGLVSEKNGKIGIGTSNPDELLTVKGKIHTQEVLVDLNGAVAPDYVFNTYYDGNSLEKPEYTFKSLSEIASFVEENRHLPAVPSAKEIEEKGLSLKEMNLLLLEKIEELTLHTLEQQKHIEVLQKKVEALENK